MSRWGQLQMGDLTIGVMQHETRKSPAIVVGRGSVIYTTAYCRSEEEADRFWEAAAGDHECGRRAGGGVSEPMAQPRTSPRQPGDFVTGCGQPAAGQTSGRSCAGAGTELSCQLCPNSPTYWRLTAIGQEAA